ncbi:uncharacterized protein LOC116266737 isoform X1 [Nymphaea colorata]|nr:uncharacterized protein LOC116266737 isoform X1 [Nymphaea colorata]
MHLGGKTSGLIKHQLSRRPSTFSVSAKNALVEAPVPRPGKEREARALMETVIVTLSSPLLAISPFLLVFFSVRLLFCAALFYRRGLLLYKAIDHDFAVFASLQPSNVEFVTGGYESISPIGNTAKHGNVVLVVLVVACRSCLCAFTGIAIYKYWQTTRKREQDQATFLKLFVICIAIHCFLVVTCILFTDKRILNFCG